MTITQSELALLLHEGPIDQDLAAGFICLARASARSLKATAELCVKKRASKAFALARELKPYGATAVSLIPAWLRSEAMLDAYGVSEANWHEAKKRSPHFAISEKSSVRRPGRRGDVTGYR